MPTRTGKAGAVPTPEPLTAAEVPVTRAMLGSLRTELLERMDQSRAEAKAGHVRLDGKIDALRAELKADNVRLDGKIDAFRVELKADIQEVKADLHGVKASMARIELLVEEQNTRNKIVLDALTAILARQNQVE